MTWGVCAFADAMHYRLRDKSLEHTADLPAPDILAAEIVEALQAALEQFSEIAEDFDETPSPSPEVAIAPGVSASE